MMITSICSMMYSNLEFESGLAKEPDLKIKNPQPGIFL